MSHYFSLFSSSLWFVTGDFDSVALVFVVVLYVVALPLFLFRLFLLLALMENLFIIIHLDPLILILCCYRLGHYYLLVLLLLPLLLLMLVQQGLPHYQMQFDLWRL